MTGPAHGSGRGPDDVEIVLYVHSVRRVPMNIQVLGNLPVHCSEPRVEIDEGETQALGKPRARCSLARPAGTDETNRILLHLISSEIRLPNARLEPRGIVTRLQGTGAATAPSRC